MFNISTWQVRFMKVRLARSLFLLSLLPVILCGAGPPASAGQQAQDDLRIVVGREAVEKLIQAALPYQFEVDLGLFKQVISLSEPRNIQLFNGGLRLTMTASGTPLPLDGEIVPELRLVENPETKEMEIRVQELPVTMGMLGKYDLASLVGAISIERTSRYLLAGSGGRIDLDLYLVGIEASPQGIELRFHTEFVPVEEPDGDLSARSHGSP